MLHRYALPVAKIGLFLPLAFLIPTTDVAAANNDTPKALHEIGVLSVLEHGATPNDESDDTAAIQAAMITARDKGMTTFIPPGVYQISDTLKCSQQTKHIDGKWRIERRLPCTLTGSSKGESILKLASGAAGFDDPKAPKPLIWIWAEPYKGNNAGSDDPEDQQASISFNQVVKDLTADIRSPRNAGAVGIRHAGSQGSTIENVKILADGAFAGFYDSPGQGGGVYNAIVEGGRYGVFAEKAARYPLFVGCRFLDQQDVAVHWEGHSLLSLVGFHIRKTTNGPAIRLVRGGPKVGKGIALVDGVIEAAGQTALDNAARKILTLDNVYIRGTKEIVSIKKQKSLEAQEGWTKVSRYVYTGNGYVSLVGGREHAEGYVLADTSPSAAPSIDGLIKPHLWDDSFPSFEDADAANVRAYGAIPDDDNDDTAAIKKALSVNRSVLLPKGTYLISDTIVLGPDSHLFGVGKTASVLRENPAWNASPGTPMLTTVDDANAGPSLSFVLLETTSPNVTPVHWRAGRKSIVRDIMVGPKDPYYQKKLPGTPHHTFLISHSGGGRWYAVAAEWGHLHGSTRHKDYSHLLVNGTREPLSFYGLNIERDAVWPQSEIRDASNVNIYYLKAEAAEWPKGEHGPGVLLVNRSSNIRLFGFAGNARPKGAANVKVVESHNIRLLQVAGFKPSDDFANLEVVKSGHSTRISGKTPLAIYSDEADAAKGTID